MKTPKQKPVPPTLEEQKAAHRKLRFLKAWFNGKLTKANVPVFRGFTFEK